MSSRTRVAPHDAAAADAQGKVKVLVRASAVKLPLGPWRCRAVWCMVVVVSMMNGLLATIFAAVYYGGMTIREGNMIESSGLMDLKNIPFVLATYLIVAAYFWAMFCQILYASLRLRRLAYFLPPNPNPRKDPQSSVPSRFLPILAWRRLRLSWSALFQPGGILELTPETFEFIFLVREVIEVSTQTYQAYKCSRLVSDQWINSVFVSILAINCWISPVIHFCVCDRGLQRFLYLASDVLLDFASTLIIPVFIIYSVVLVAFQQNLDPGSGIEYAFDIPNSDEVIAHILKSTQQICVVGWVDFITKILPFISMGSCLSLIKRTVTAAGAPVIQHNQIQDTSVVPRSFQERVKSRILSSRDELNKRTNSQVRGMFSFCCNSRLIRWLLSVRFVHTTFFIWGIVIVACHIQAYYISTTENNSSIVGCKSTCRPWFVNQLSCSVLEINCHRRNITGSEVEIDQALATVDAGGVSSLILSHCPQLHVPPRLQSLRNLMGLEIADSTLVSWDQEAALTASSNPSMIYFSITRSNTTGIPAGLKSIEFPRRWSDVSIAQVNLSTTRLLDELPQWRHLLNVYIERAQLDEIPPAIDLTRADRLSLMGNNIHSIPDDLLANHRFLVISVAKNPITRWPANIGKTNQLTMAIMDYTEIAELPAWMLDEAALRATTGSPIIVSAGGSAYCRNRANAPASIPGLTISCRKKPDEEFEAFPLSFNVANRPR